VIKLWNDNEGSVELESFQDLVEKAEDLGVHGGADRSLFIPFPRSESRSINYKHL
jgi:hypothetical protein